jgi:hypothetical protein
VTPPPLFSTLKDVSATLLDLLKVNLSDIEGIVLEPPSKATADTQLTLFLYKVIESPEAKNAERQVVTRADGSLVERRPVLTLDAYYLLTAHAKPDLLSAHLALGRAMRVFFDNGVVHGSLLRAQNGTKGLTADAVLRITLNPISMEDMTRIWSVFPDTPYEISVTYLVTPVPIWSEQEEPLAPVVDRVGEFGQPGALLGAAAG